MTKAYNSSKQLSALTLTRRRGLRRAEIPLLIRRGEPRRVLKNIVYKKYTKYWRQIMKKTVKVITIAVAAAALGIFLWSALCAEAEPNVRIIRETEQRVGPASPDNFTGEAISRGYFPAREIGVSTGEVTFKPGARTAWHTHPRGQMLIITEGRGLVRQWGEEPQEMREGDAVWIPAGVKHWHGAAPDSGVTHIALAPLDEEGRSSTWMEKTNGEDYPGN